MHQFLDNTKFLNFLKLNSRMCVPVVASQYKSYISLDMNNIIIIKIMNNKNIIFKWNLFIHIFYLCAKLIFVYHVTKSCEIRK